MFIYISSFILALSLWNIVWGCVRIDNSNHHCETEIGFVHLLIFLFIWFRYDSYIAKLSDHDQQSIMILKRQRSQEMKDQQEIKKAKKQSNITKCLKDGTENKKRTQSNESRADDKARPRLPPNSFILFKKQFPIGNETSQVINFLKKKKIPRKLKMQKFLKQFLLSLVY